MSLSIVSGRRTGATEVSECYFICRTNTILPIVQSLSDQLGISYWELIALWAYL